MPYTDDISKITNYAPYVETEPLQMLMQVGAQRQQQYNQGLELIQQEYKQTQSLENNLIRPELKEYLKTKLSNLKSSLSGAIAGDLSNQSLVSNISGAVRSVVSDEYIKNGIISHGNYTSENKKLEKQKEEGKTSPANILNFEKQVNSYMTSSDLKEIFKGEYKSYFDIDKFTRETFNAVKPGKYTVEQLYVTDNNGKIKRNSKGVPEFSPIMTKLVKEGRLPEEVRQTMVNIMSDPRVAQQLQIDGEYDYRNSDAQTLMNKVSASKYATINNIQAQIDQLSLNLNLTKGDKTGLAEEIAALEKYKVETIPQNYKQIEESIMEGVNNPSKLDAVRGLLHKTDVMQQWTSMYGTMSSEETHQDNPGWRANFDVQKEANNQYWKQAEFNQRKEFHKDNLFIDQLKITAVAAAAAAKENKGNPITLNDQPSTYAAVTNFQAEVDKAMLTVSESTDNLIFQSLYKSNPEANSYINNFPAAKGQSNNERIKMAINSFINKEATKQHKDPAAFRTNLLEKANIQISQATTVDPVIADALAGYTNANKTQKLLSKDAKLLSELNQIGSNFKTIPGYVSATSKKTFDVDATDMLDLAALLKKETTMFSNSETDKEAANYAEKRLKSKGKWGLYEDAKLANLDVASSQLTDNSTKATMQALGSFNYNPFAIFSEKARDKRSAKQTQTSRIQSQLYGVLDIVNQMNSPEYQEKITTLANNLTARRVVIPDVKQNLLTGNTEDDKKIKAALAGFAGVYNNGSGNLSSDFKDFASNIYMEGTTPVAMLSPQNNSIEIVLFNKSSERVGAMTIEADEASTLPINVRALQMPEKELQIKNYIFSNSNKSSVGDPTLQETYDNGDFILSGSDFSKLRGAKQNVKVNFTYSNNKFYPHIYMKSADGSKTFVKNTFDGVADFSKLLEGLDNLLDPYYIESTLLIKR